VKPRQVDADDNGDTIETGMRFSHQLVILSLLLISAGLSAQEQPTIIHERVPCLRAFENPLLTARLRSEGQPRVYFRRHGAEDWCYVDGIRVADEGIVTLPGFPKDMELEYFFVTFVGERITGRSMTIYRVPIQEGCSVEPARHTAMQAEVCAGTSLGGAIGGNFTSQDVEVSPSTPQQ